MAARPAAAKSSVALYARAWVEILPLPVTLPSLSVALYARAWVEMPTAYFLARQN